MGTVYSGMNRALSVKGHFTEIGGNDFLVSLDGEDFMFERDPKGLSLVLFKKYFASDYERTETF